MSNGDALLRAIVTYPDENTPRLMYADWLEENGNSPWAQFIRHQIWTPVSPCRNAPLTALISLEPFVGPLPHKYSTNTSGIGGATVAYPNGMVFWFTRGFVSRVEMSCADFMTHAEAIFRAHPVVTVRLTDREPDEEFANHLIRLWHNDEGLSQLDEAPSLIPEELFTRLPASASNESPGIEWGATSEELAITCLSRAAVAHGRELAGLPPLAT